MIRGPGHDKNGYCRLARTGADQFPVGTTRAAGTVRDRVVLSPPSAVDPKVTVFLDDVQVL